jgi:hypothetical protein
LAKSELSETGVEFLFLSDAAEVSPDGKLHLIGGGLAWVTRSVPPVSDLPAPPTSFAIVACFRIGWNDTNTEFPLRILVGSLDESDVLVQVSANVTAGRPPHLGAGDSVYIPLAVPVLANFPAAGHYVVRASLAYHGEERDKTVRFTVVDAPMPAPAISHPL